MIDRSFVQRLARAAISFAALVAWSAAASSAWGEDLDEALVTFEIVEGAPDDKSWNYEEATPTTRFSAPAAALARLPKKYSADGLIVDRAAPFVVRAVCSLDSKAGEYRLLLRARGASRLMLDGELIAATPFRVPNTSGHESVPELAGLSEPGLRPLPPGHNEQLVTVSLDGGRHVFTVEVIVGDQKLRPELGELSVCVAPPGEPFFLLSPEPSHPADEAAWRHYTAETEAQIAALDTLHRRETAPEEIDYWRRRHDLARAYWDDQPITPPTVSDESALANGVDRFLQARRESLEIEPPGELDDWAFLRRVTLDTVGVIPSRDEIAAYESLPAGERRRLTIERLLDDPRWADHWVGYWQDVLAENPGILKPELNNTGPFRWWIYESFLDDKPFDRFATELVLMQGSRLGGGPAGFAMATQNDSPMAQKAHVLSKAFLGIELKCARCHDAPYHPFQQRDTFSLAAMLKRGPLELPRTSTVPIVEGGRIPAVEVSLRPGDAIEPAWPFAEVAPANLPPGVLRNTDDARERLAAILTSPHNERFAEVIVNRLWARWLGWGLVDPVDDWESGVTRSPELLRYLARELMTHDYNLKHVARLILGSRTYQSEVAADDDGRRHTAPLRRRMSAEQVVDSLFAAVDKSPRAEALNLDPDGRRPTSSFLNLGAPRRAWEFASLSNERDRPALSLPRAQSIVDVLTAFGWRQSRQDPITLRDESPNVLQPLVVANGLVGGRIVSLSDDSAVTALCLEEIALPAMVEQLFFEVLCRPPEPGEAALFVALLADGFEDRRIEVDMDDDAPDLTTEQRTAVSWSNHLSPEASRIKLELERAARAGDPPTARLVTDWRERMEDSMWALVNSPEFVFLP